MFQKVHHPSPSSPYFCHFMVHVFLSLPPNPPILPSPRLPPCASVTKGAGLGERLKSCGGHLIKNNKASSAHLGQARQRSESRFAPLQRHRGVETEGRDWQGSENAAEAVEGQGRPSFITHSCFMFCLPYSFDASHTHTHTPTPSVFACWWRRDDSCGRK